MPENTKILANGAIYDLDKGRIIGNPGGGTTAITQAQSSAMANLRWDRYRQAAADGGMLAAKTLSPSNVTEYDAFVLMSANIARLAMEKSDRTAVEAYRAYSQAVGYTAKQDQDSIQPVNITNIVGDNALRMVLLAQLGIVSDNYSYTNHDDMVDSDIGGRAEEENEEEGEEE